MKFLHLPSLWSCFSDSVRSFLSLSKFDEIFLSFLKAFSLRFFLLNKTFFQNFFVGVSKPIANTKHNSNQVSIYNKKIRIMYLLYGNNI